MAHLNKNKAISDRQMCYRDLVHTKIQCMHQNVKLSLTCSEFDISNSLNTYVFLRDEGKSLLQQICHLSKKIDNVIIINSVATQRAKANPVYRGG